MRRITGTHVYSYVKCPRLAALDLHLGRDERRPAHPWEEFAAQRGRDFEDSYIERLRAAGVVVARPEHPERDFAAGAAATMAMLRAGDHDLVHQAVLQCEDRLGLPDLLRKLPGASELGDHRYEVLDVKTSGRPRGEQILQVVFYSRLLAELQGVAPTHGALVLKDGREERFALADYDAAGREVEAALRRLREQPEAARPFLQGGCAGCYHDGRCVPQLEAADDLSLVQGMTHGARAILERLGVRTVADLATFHPEGARQRGQLESALVRRLRRAAQARLDGKPLVEERPRHERIGHGAVLQVLTDAFADRVLAIGLLHPVRADGTFRWRRIASADQEWQALKEIVATVPPSAPLLHFGGALPRWYAEHAFSREADPAIEARLVDLDRRLRGSVVYPRAVFGLPDLVRFGLGRDPLRAGHASDAARWAGLPEGDARMEQKLRADLDDLAALALFALGGVPTATAEAAT